MKPLRIIAGDATSPQAKGPKIIAHVCNDLGGWGKGFVLAVSKRWPEPEAAFRAWHRGRSGNDFGLGAVQVVRVKPDVWVANMVGQRGIRTGSGGRRSATTPFGAASARWPNTPSSWAPVSTCRASGAGSRAAPGRASSR